MASFTASKRPKHLRQKRWDPFATHYADLSYPEWVQDRVPSGFWNDPHNHRRYIDWFAKKFAIEKLDDWYRVRGQDVIENRGTGFLERYNNSLVFALTTLFPKYDWYPWKFIKVPIGFWNHAENRKRYIKWLEQRLGIKKRTDWYQCTQDHLINNYGAGLIGQFACSIQKLLADVYPRYPWKPWLFVQVPKKFWRDKSNRLVYLKWLGKKLGFEQPDDWYQLTAKHLLCNHGSALVVIYGEDQISVLSELFPERKWYAWKFLQTTQGY